MDREDRPTSSLLPKILKKLIPSIAFSLVLGRRLGIVVIGLELLGNS
jgi:hypothetical protein